MAEWWEEEGGQCVEVRRGGRVWLNGRRRGEEIEHVKKGGDQMFA